MNFKFATLCFVLCYLHVSSAVTFTITQDAAAIVESNATTSWVFTVTRDSTSGPVDIGVSTISSGVYNSANLATDIVALNNVSLTFPDGVASETFNVSIVGDIIYEYNETFIITLEVGSSDTFTPFTVTILNDDPLPIVQAVGSGSEAAASITINFQMNRPSELICTANWRTTSGTALQNVDYVGKTGSQVFPAGTLLTQNTIVPVADTVDEVNEVVVLAANGASGNCTFAGGQVVIIDDDPASTVVNVTNSVIAGFEGSSAATAAVLQWTLNLSPVSGQYVNITYQVAGGTASYGTDYVAPAGPSGVFSIPPGASTASFWVKIIPDVFWETDETVLISIISISGGTWSTALPIVLNGTIRNDDAVPSMIVADVAWAEGNTAPTFRGIIIFTGTGWTQQNITVGYTLMDGTAEAGVDYQNVTSAVNIVGGNATAIIPFLGNTNSNAANRTFYFVITDISCPACAGLYTPTITKGTGIVTILDDDLPEVFVRGSSVTEAYGAVLSFTVSIQVNQTSDVVVYYSVTGGTATPGLDFVAVTGNVTISAGLFSAVVNISVLNDTVSEPTETVFLTVTSVTGPGTAGNNGTGYILDSPSTPLPVVYTYNITVIEGDSGNTTGFVPVSLSFSSSRIVNITYSTRDESAYTPSDYYTVDGWIAFYPGETQKNISVLIVADTKEETEKSFIVRLNSVSNASFGNYTAGVLISDDDALMSVAVQSDVYEGSPAFNPRFIGLIVVIGVVVIAIIASIVGFFALKRYVS